MKKYLTLAALISILGITWAAAATPSTASTESTSAHQHQAMGAGHGRMQGMMNHSGMQGMDANGKNAMHGAMASGGKMPCDMPAHGAGEPSHRHETPAKP